MLQIGHYGFVCVKHERVSAYCGLQDPDLMERGDFNSPHWEPHNFASDIGDLVM